MNIIEWTTELRLALALALGFLVGLERESTKIEQGNVIFGGVRTYPIISLLGFGCAWLQRYGVGFMLPVGLSVMGVLAAIAYTAKTKAGHHGFTSEASALLTFVVGAVALLADVWIAMALAVVNTVLLSEKAELETYLDSFNKVEFLAVVKFILVTVIILPVLPNQNYTPFDLNPTRIWQVVILVSSIGFVGYFLSKRYGNTVSLWLSGILGGIVSSTATTVALARVAQRNPEHSSMALQASVLSSSIAYLRILVLILVINPAYLGAMWWRLTLLFFIGVILSFRVRPSGETEEKTSFPNLHNPFEIRPSIVFALMFVLLMIVTKLIEQRLGSTGLLVLSTVVGFTDVTPFVLSLLHPSATMARSVILAVTVAMMSNTIAKSIYFALVVPETRRETFLRYGAWAALHVPLLMM
ncbi:MAG TPA: MgtC/SapB family protein [Bacteroidota bacterium]|nr:MgtC/SapB family protein [Bacteroidota bacterium]